MIKTIINAWKIADLRKKMIYTLFILFLFRLGCAIPVPFVNILAENGLGTNGGGTFLDYLSMMTGDAFSYGRLFALGVTPYINASIILQLLAVAIPALEKLSHDEDGRKKMATITRYVTIGLAVMQGVAYYVYLWSQGNMLTTDASGNAYTGFGAFFQGLVIVSCLTAGSALVMWLGEQINDKGIGNGISLILFAGIVSRLPTIIYQLLVIPFQKGSWYHLVSAIAIISLVLMLAYIVWMDGAERRIPVQYAKRVVGRKMYGGQNSNIPIKVNMSGVLPVIFASSILSLPPTIQMFVANKIDETTGWGKFWDTFFSWFKSDNWVYGIIYFLLIIFFAYFYASIQYNPVEMANNLAKNSGMIPGIRSGKPTAEYIAKVISKIVLLGALMLSVVALYPILFSQVTTALDFQDLNLNIGGTSLIILVGVALETVQQIESQMMMRHYKGFLD
ncbi:MAG: preprotein translocase subunit SecY [Clostridia bacterium]|nr:preprotein translocase subunit SecY [Clostridia bacterium]